MRIKKIDIFGFKSFAIRQAIHFGDGITAIVGPNGCGKSNVVDAIRWVMGEQNVRHLRGGSMQDVIFCGSEKKGPLGFAEVSITFDNADGSAPLDFNHYSEIEITRRLYKSGESEYEINRQKARLRDIADFFLGTGVGTKAYSIIEQGRVNEVISAKPADRRLIIEEAAGITKYKARKISAEKRIQATRTNLSRISDIKAEIDKRVNALSRDKEKLDRVRNTKNQIRHLDLHSASHRYLSLSGRLSFLGITKERHQENIGTLKQEVAFFQHAFDEILERFSKTEEEKRILENLESQHKNALELLKKDLDYAQKSLADNEQTKSRLEQQIRDLEDRNAESIVEIERFNKESLAIKEEVANVKKNLEREIGQSQGLIELRHAHSSEEKRLQAELVRNAQDAARLQAEIQALKEQEKERFVLRSSVLKEIEEKSKESKDFSERLIALENESAEAKIREEALKIELQELEHEILELETELKAKTLELEEDQNEERGLASRAKSLQEISAQLEWSDSGIHSVFASDLKPLVKAILADVLDVERGYEEVVERCLANFLDIALLEEENSLLALSKFLKQKKAATTSFFVKHDTNNFSSQARLLGLKCLADFVRIKDNSFSDVISLFNQYFIADSLEDALKHWKGAQLSQSVIVSKEGEMLLPNGAAIVFGAKNQKGVLQRKNEQKDIASKLAILRESIAYKFAVLEDQKRKQKALHAQKQAKLNDLKPLSLGLIRLDESLKQRRHEIDRIKKESERLQNKQEELSKSVNVNDERILDLQKKWALALDNHKNSESTLEYIKDLKKDSDFNYENYQARLKDLEIQRAQVQERAHSISHALSQAEKNLDLVVTQISVLKTNLEEKEREVLIIEESKRQSHKKMEELIKEIELSSQHLAKVKIASSEVAKQKFAHELELDKRQKAIQSEHDQSQSISLDISKTDSERAFLLERIFERYRCSLLESIFDFHLLPLDEKSAQKDLEDLKRNLERIGPVNENAALEYDEFFARQTFLDAQILDLNSAIEQLESAIKKINKTTRQRFKEAFDSINQQFSLVFPRLFNGGHAELLLTEDEDLLNAGVEIVARPPGKNISSIELMSGGEKALTAISLIMAIFLIKPSPFCLLDEVDAPLDETNVSRFSQLVKEMSSLSQFIVITHNRKTMECADQLYGVTMEDAGMSKIVAVAVKEAFESLKEKNEPQTPKVKPTQLFLDELV
jgi:chromosome segregation protein